MPDIAPITPDSLMLVDGLNIIRRVYGAQDGPDTEEKVEAALKSSFGSFKRALREVQPTHALVACDYGGHTWRHDLYPDYRKSREPMPQILRDALPAFHARIRD